MLNLRDLRIDPASLGNKMLLVDVIPAYEYKDGKRTETVTGYRYVVCLAEHSLEKLSVRRSLILTTSAWPTRSAHPGRFTPMFTSPMRFGTVKKRFPTAHIDKATGTSKEIRNYVCKQGKWADTDKAKTSIEGTFKATSDMPPQRLLWMFTVM